MKKGFTLIELLVVIAIIGILASVVLIGFPSAANKARDSRVAAAIGQARTVMTYIGHNDDSYVAFDETHSEIVTLWAEITANADDDVAYTNYGIHGGTLSEGACIYAHLRAKSDYWYCADSTGVAGFIEGTDPGDATYCDGTTFVCPTITQS